MALSVGLLLLLLAGAVDLGRALDSYIAVMNASRGGAHYASRFPRPAEGIDDAGQREVDNVGTARERPNATTTQSGFCMIALGALPGLLTGALAWLASRAFVAHHRDE